MEQSERTDLESLNCEELGKHCIHQMESFRAESQESCHHFMQEIKNIHRICEEKGFSFEKLHWAHWSKYYGSRNVALIPEIVSKFPYFSDDEMKNQDARDLYPILFEMIEFCLKLGLDINENRNENRPTALILAIKRGHIELVKKVISLGGDVNAYAACTSPLKEVLGILPNCHKENVSDGLGSLQEEEAYSILECLIKSGIEINRSEAYSGITPIMRCAMNKGRKFFAALVGAGADLNRKDHQDWNVWSYAIKHHNIEVLQFLIEQHNDKKNIKDHLVEDSFVRTLQKVETDEWQEKTYGRMRRSKAKDWRLSPLYPLLQDLDRVILEQEELTRITEPGVINVEMCVENDKSDRNQKQIRL